MLQDTIAHQILSKKVHCFKVPLFVYGIDLNILLHTYSSINTKLAEQSCIIYNNTVNFLSAG